MLRRRLLGLFSIVGRTERALVLLVRNLAYHGAPTAAAAMAFDAFLSLIPLTALAGWIFDRLHQSGKIVFGSVLRAAPIPVQGLFDTEFFRLSEGGAVALPPISILLFLWVSSAGASTAMGVFETTFVCESRPYWRRRAIAIGYVIGALVALTLTTAAAFLIASLSGTLGAAIVAAIVPVLVLIGSVTAFFRIGIRRPRAIRRRIFPGAIVTIVLWSIVSTLFSTYVRYLARFSTLYGSLAAVAVLLFWLWLLSLSLLVGGEVNAQLEGVRDAPPSAPR